MPDDLFDPSKTSNLYRDPSGIWRIRSTPPEKIDLPAGFEVEAVPLALGHVPTFFDQLWSYITGAELAGIMLPDEPLHLLDRPVLDRRGIVDILRATPLEPAIRLTVWLQRRLYVHGFDRAKQLETMTNLCGAEFAKAGEVFLDARPRRSLFSEQQIFAMQRLLMLHANDQPAEDLTAQERARFTWALLWIPDAILDLELLADQRLTSMDVADERLLRFFVANSGLASHPALRHELARAHRLYEVIAKSVAAKRHRDYCPIDDWLLEEYGLNFVELQTLGFAFFAGSNVGDRADGQLRFTNHDYFANTGLAARLEKGLTAIAAPRHWFVGEFSSSRSSPRRAAVDIQLFFRRPALFQNDGNAVVLGLRALEAWLGATGAYYRVLDTARRRGMDEMDRFRRFNGFLQERYFRQLTHIAHPHPRQRAKLSGTGRVVGEQTYSVRGRGEHKTSDIAVDLGLDLVLMEVTSSRMTVKSLVDGEEKAVVRDLTKLILSKMRQLDRVASDLIAERATLPDVDITLVRRIWPVLIYPDGLFHSPTLWAWCAKNAGHLLQNRLGQTQEIKPLILLDAEEHELLMGLVAEDVPLIEVFENKTEPLWRERDFKAWFLETRGGRGGELPFIRQEVARNQRAMERVLRATPIRGPLDMAA